MKDFNPRLSLSRHLAFIARVVLMAMLVAGIALVATRGNFGSRASEKSAITTESGEIGRDTPLASVNSATAKPSTLSPVCVVDPIVANNSDSGAGSLRQAIADACDASTITFNMATVTSPITLTTAELSINKNLTITGPGSSTLTVQRSTAGGTPNFRIFKINSGNTVSISGLTISNGQTPASFGGGIWNELSVLNLLNCTVSGNSASHGGGIFNNIGTLNVTSSTFIGNSAVNNGGGIDSDSDSTLNIANSTFSGNSANGGGAVMNESIATVTNSTLTGNTGFGNGGGIFNQPNAQASIRNSILALNTSVSNCGGNCPNGSPDLFGNFTSLGHNIVGSTAGATISAQTGDQFGTPGALIDPKLGALANNGGPTQTHALLPGSSAIDAGDNCVVTNSCSPALGFSLTTDQRGAGFNRSADGNGDGTATVDIGAYEVQAILVTNTADSGAGSLRQAITDANVNADTNAINFQAGLTGTITPLTVLPDLSTSMTINGPGANVLTVMRSAVPATPQFRLFTVSGASAVQIGGLTIRNGLNANGGGILNQSNATLILTNCAITGNAADFGGGIRNEGRLTVTRSTISGNTASAFAGGGIINRGSAATATIIDSTVSGNQAGAGGGIFDDGVTTTLTLTNCTITNNTATSPGSASGLHTNNQSNQTPGNAKVGNTIIAGNSGAGPELLGFFTSQGHNLIGVSAGANGFTNGSNGDQVGTSGSPLNARLGVLANNGGPTETHALLPSSPALNAGSNTLATNAGLTTDQRGLPRITNTTVDIGAFESRGFTIAATSGTPQSAPILTAFGSSLVATVSSAFGEPVAGGRVTFTAPASGASGTFPGSVKTSTVTIAANGTATAPVFTANGTAGGPYNVIASLAGGSPSVNFALTNLKGNQTITVNTHAPANATYNGQFTVAATASSGLAVTYTSSGACTNSAATFTMNSGTGTCTVKYDQAGNANYNAATQVTESVTAQKANQTITFGALSAKTFGDPDFPVTASTDATGLTVSFVASGQCTVTAVSPGTVHLTAPGSCTITAKQAGDSNYNAAADVPRSFNIANAVTSTAVSSSLNPSSLSQSVTFTATVSSAVAGTPTGAVQFKDGGADIGSPQTLNGSAQATISTTSLTAGSHVITAVYSGDATYATSTGTLSGGQFVNDAPVISLSQASYNTSETTGFVTITVNRAGFSGPAVTVDYTTDDTGASNSCANTNNLASSRCDFTTAAGTLHFASGEMQKTFVVVVNQDSYTEGPELFTVNLSNPTGGASLSSPSGATVTIADDSSGLPPNAIDDVDFFVRQQYHDFLSREPDTSGYNFWRNQINSCGSNAQCIDLKRTNVSAAFFVSVEFQNSGYLVERLYKASYGDGSGMSTCCTTPSHSIPVPIVRFNEFLPDTQAIGHGLIVGAPGWEALLESNTQALIADFVQRQRFLTAFPLSMTTADFVDALNVNAGSPLSQSERDQLINSGKSRAEILRAVAEDQDLYDAEYRRAFVLMQYFGYLRRNPSDSPEQNLDYTGYDFWLLKLNAKNGNYITAEMVRSFLLSGEYRQRFGTP